MKLEIDLDLLKIFELGKGLGKQIFKLKPSGKNLIFNLKLPKHWAYLDVFYMLSAKKKLPLFNL